MRPGLTLVGGVVRELALGAVYDHAGDEVASENENLSDDEALPEVISTDKTSQLDSITFITFIGFTYGRLISAISSLKSVAPP